MKRYAQRTSFSTLSEINVTPLLDLAFVLLIIFMITTPLLENSTNLTIPSSRAPGPEVNKAAVQTLSIDRASVMRLNNEPVDAQSLGSRLAEVKRQMPDVAVIIRADRELPVQELVRVMDVVQSAGIKRVGIATKAESR